MFHGRDPWEQANCMEKQRICDIAFTAGTHGSKDMLEKQRKINETIFTARDPGEQGRKSPFDGEIPSPRPPPYLPPRIFLPRACSSFPTGLGQRPSRAKKNDTIAFSRGPRATLTPREFLLILSGITLSLILISNHFC